MTDLNRNNYIWNAANTTLKKGIEHYFTELAGDSIPTARNPRIPEVLAIKEIKNDPQWMSALEYQSYLQNVAIDELLKSEAQNVINGKPLMRDMTEEIPAEAKMEILVRGMMEEMRNKPQMVKQIEEKAQNNGMTFEEQLRADARWIINRKVEKGEIVLEEKP